MKTQAIVCQPGRSPEAVTIESADITRLQDLIGGYFTVVPQTCLSPQLQGLTVYVKDDGENLPMNWMNKGGLPLFGTMVITRTNSEGADVGLTAEEIETFLSFRV